MTLKMLRECRRTTGVARRAVLFAAAAFAPGVRADTETWTAGTALWSGAGNWSLGVAPRAGDVVNVAQADAITRTVTYDASATSGAGFASLTVNASGAGRMTLSQTAGSLTVAGAEVIGNGGKGTLSQTGGTNNALGGVILGELPGDLGTYALGGKGLLIAPGLAVGYQGQGVFSQTAGIVTLGTSSLSIGGLAGGSGTFALSGTGMLSVPQMQVGDSGAGVFVQFGGTATIAGNVSVGNASTASGVYTVSGGINNVGSTNGGNLYIGGNASGAGGSGILNVSGGTMTVANTLKVWGTASAAVNLSGGTLSVGALDPGANASSFNWTGGTFAVTGSNGVTLGTEGLLNSVTLDASRSLKVTKTLTVPAGDVLSLNAGGALTVGTLDTGGDPSRLNWTAGTLSITGSNGLNFDVGQPLGAAFSLTNGRNLTVFYQESIGAMGAVPFAQTAGTHAVGTLVLGGGPAASGTYTLGGTGVLTATNEFVGSNGAGTFIQTGGTHTVSNGLRIGTANDSTGSYSLGADGTLTTGYDQVGFFGTGAFTQSGGTHATQALYIAYNASSKSNYALSGGTLTVAYEEDVGYEGSGTFNQTGGANRVNGYLYLGEFGGSSGTYTLSGGSLSVNLQGEYVGSSGPGTFIQSGGVNTVNSTLSIGNGASGNYALSGDAVLTVGTEYVAAMNVGTFLQTGGTHVANSLYVGEFGGSAGTYSLSGSASLTAGTEVVGGSGVGAFTQAGGTHVVNAALTIGQDGKGSYALSNGSLSAGSETVGYYGNGTFSQSGGTHNVAGEFDLARVTGYGGTYSLSGAGVLTLGGPAFIGGGSNGAGGAGVLNVAGGSMTVGGTLTVWNANAAAVNVTGGSLTAQGVVNSGTWMQTGGTASLGALSGGGTLAIGGGPGTAVATVASFSQSAVTLNPGGTLAVLNGAARVTNSAAAVVIAGGLLDLAQNNLITQTPVSTLRANLLSAYAGGAWSGTTGITSANAVADPTHIAIAYVASTSTATVFLRPSLIGDANLDGKVNGLDTRQIYTSGAFNDGQNSHDWSQGDMNYDGSVNGLDTRLIYTSGNFNGAAQAFASPKLTSSSASATPGPIVVGAAREGKPYLTYDPTNGDVAFEKNGDAETIVEVLLHSDGGSLNPRGFNATLGSTADTHSLDVQSATGITAYDFGAVLPAGLTPDQVAAILASFDGANDPAGLGRSGMYVLGAEAEQSYDMLGIPEPAGLSLISTFALGLWARSRRRR